MSTSNVYSFTVNTRKIVNLAAKYLGKLGENEDLTDSEYVDCRDFLNMLVKQWIVANDSANGLKTWLRHRGYLFLNSTSGEYRLSSGPNSYWTNDFYTTLSGGNNPAGSYIISLANVGPIQANDTIGIQCDDGSLFWSTIAPPNNGASGPYIPANSVAITSVLPVASNGPGNYVFSFKAQAQPPQLVETIVLRDNLGNDTPIAMINLQDYQSLPSKTAQDYYGDPLTVYIEPHLVSTGANSFVSLFTDVAGAQDTSKYFVLSYLQEIQDFVNLNDEPDFPKEWQMALVLNLAKHVAPMFNAPWSQEQNVQARDALLYARNARKKTSTQGFVPGIRSAQDVTNVQWR